MKSLFSLIAPVVVALAAAQVQAAPTTLNCKVSRSPDWGAEIAVENGELKSISFRNLSGTVVSNHLRVAREADQIVPGFVFYRINGGAPYQMRVEEGLLTKLSGHFFIQSPYVEMPDDEYFCRQ